MKILSGPASLELGKTLTSILGVPVLALKHKLFYDGESYLQIEGKIEGEDIILVQTTAPPQEKRLIEILLLSNTLKEKGADKVILIAPYLCYARADRARLEGEVISHKYTLELLHNSGVDSLITINVHNPQAYYSFVPELEKINLNAFGFLAKRINEIYPGKDWIVVAPDKGAAEDAQTIATILGTEAYHLEKYRDPHTHEVKFEPPTFDTKGKDVLMIDDIVTSGGTAIKAGEIVLGQAPESVTYLFIHFLAREETVNRMRDLGIQTIMSSNTIVNESIRQIDIAPLISNLIREKYM